MDIDPKDVIPAEPEASGQEIDPGDVIPGEAPPQPTEPEEKPQSPLEPLHAALQAAESQLTFGGSDILIPKMVAAVTGKSEEEVRKHMRERLEQHPTAETVGDIAGGAASLVGLNAAAEAATGVNTAISQLPKWSKYGANILKGITEGAVLGGSKEISDAALGKTDPESTLASALSNVGVSGLVGGGINGTLGLGGMALKKVADAKSVMSVKKFLGDLAAQSHFEKGVSNISDTLLQELQQFHESTSAIGDEARGSSGIKAQVIDKLGEAVDPNQAVKHIGHVSEMIERAPEELQNNKQFQRLAEDWRSIVAPTDAEGNPVSAKPSDIFKATEQFKRQLQEWGKYNKQIAPLSEQPFRNAARSLATGFKDSLEDTSIWGDLGTVQKKYNSAISNYLKPLKDFQSQFTRKVENEPVVDLGKVSTFLNQEGKNGNAYRTGALRNYLDAAKNFRQELENLHGNLGLESPFEEAPMPLTEDVLNNSKPLGARAASAIYRSGIPTLVGKVATRATGALLGGVAGGPAGAAVGTMVADPMVKQLTPLFEKAIGQPLKNHAIPFALRAFTSGVPGAVPEAVEFGNKVNKGQYLIKSVLNNVLKPEASMPPYSAVASDADKKRLKKFVEDGGVKSQLDNEMRDMNRQPAQKPDQYAEGGEVDQPDAPTDQDAGNPFLQAFPEHAQGMLQARSRIYNYLNSIRPVKSDSGPMFDSMPTDKLSEINYDKALNTAIHPLSVMNKVKNGTIDATDMKHLINLHPEVYSYMSKELTKKLMDSKMKGEMPDYKTRQGMSLFLGSPLDSTMSPMGIQAAQAVFQPPPVPAKQGGAQGKTRKGTSTLGKSNQSYKTGSQEGESDRADRG